MKKIFLIVISIIFASVIKAQGIECAPSDTSRAFILFSAENVVASDSTFSIGKSTKVKFTNGNLMYRPCTNTWKIAPRQFDYVGCKYEGTTADCDLVVGKHYGTIYVQVGDERVLSTRDSIDKEGYKGWIDCFEFGTGDLPETVIEAGEKYRTPTEAEYKYLVNTRTNASKLRGRASITIPGNGSDVDTVVNGLILLPDNWDPSLLPYKVFKSDADGCWFFHDNQLSLTEWELLEAQGALFFPAAGGGAGHGAQSNSRKPNRSGYYWTGSKHKSLEFGGFRPNANDIPSFVNTDQYNRRAIRLCKEVTE